MKLPTPDPAGRDADEIRPQYEAAIDNGAWVEALNLAVRALYVTALNICQASGVEPPRPLPARLLQICIGLRDACDEHIAANGEDFKIQTARDTFATLVSVETVLRGGIDDLSPTEIIARLLLMGATIGHADVMQTLMTTGIWDDYDDAARTRHNVGSPRRGLQPKWEVGFLDEAQRFSAQMGDGLTQGALIRQAKRWAKEQKAKGVAVDLPTTDAGIAAGIRRLRERGDLFVPGLGG